MLVKILGISEEATSNGNAIVKLGTNPKTTNILGVEKTVTTNYFIALPFESTIATLKVGDEKELDFDLFEVKERPYMDTDTMLKWLHLK